MAQEQPKKLLLEHLWAFGSWPVTSRWTWRASPSSKSRLLAQPWDKIQPVLNQSSIYSSKCVLIEGGSQKLRKGVQHHADKHSFHPIDLLQNWKDGWEQWIGLACQATLKHGCVGMEFFPGPCGHFWSMKSSLTVEILERKSHLRIWLESQESKQYCAL